MTVVRGFVITLASGFSFAAFGCAAGYVLAVVAPDYYRTMFQIPTAAEINVRHLGLALGLTQGFATGLVVGAVIVVSVAWYNSRVEKSRATTMS